MIPCRVRDCRNLTKEFFQVSPDPALEQMAERRLVLQGGRTERGPWVAHREGRSTGVYCGHCKGNLEYSDQDLSDYAINDPPLLFVPPQDFSVDEALRALKRKWGKRVVYVKELDAQPERLADSAIIGRLSPDLSVALTRYVLPPGGQLYLHQGAAVEAALMRKNVVVVTATASGKTLCYQLPILHAALENPTTCALYLSPLKALGADQFDSICRFDPEQSSRPATGEPILDNFFRHIRFGGKQVSVGVYDGNTPEPLRPKIKYDLCPNVLITTPDSLNTAILSRSAEWKWFFERLRYVVIDEMHIYRGIFGSNFANLMRRLRRLCSYHSAKPQFLFCSATVRNPDALARNLIGNLAGDEVTVVGPELDGAPKHLRKFVLMRGTEDTLATDARKVVVEVLGIQRASVITFGQSIPMVNRVYRDTGQALTEMGITTPVLQPFMAPLPPDKKRDITRRLAAGVLRGVISTTALQLGIDIGSFSVALLMGYPRSIAATWQQAGRAGRRGEALYILLAEKDPIDEFWLEHPEVFFDEQPEEVIVDPDNKYVLLNQLWCAHKDLEIDEERDGAFFGRDFRGRLEELKLEGKVVNVSKGGRDVWVLKDENGFPAKEVPLRNPLGKDKIKVVTDVAATPVAFEDSYRATRRLHRFAIYQVIDDYYEVDELVLDGPDRYAKVHRLATPAEYYTTAVSQDSSEIIDAKLSRQSFNLPLHHGDVTFNSEVVAYTRNYYLPRQGRQQDYQPLGKARPPKRSFDTKATWIDFPARWAAEIGSDTLYDALNSIGKALVSATGILRFADPSDLGALAETKEKVRLTVHEQYPGGIGLAERCYYRFEELLQCAYQILADCTYCTRHTESKGCPRCAIDADGRHDRHAALKLLQSCLSERRELSGVKTPTQVVSALEELGYQVVELIESGGMGAVYRAQKSGRTVALKVIEPRFWRESPEARDLLLQEGKVWEGLAHPNVVKLHSVQESAGVLFLEMEFAGNGTLRSRIGRGLPPSQAVPLFKGVCDGVAYLHEKSLVHRDLKPHNVLFVQLEVPKISDFGLAKVLTGRSVTTLGGGTPGYWAPEQRQSRGRISAATDVFALGVILFQMLTGRLPTLDSAEQFAVGASDAPQVPARFLELIGRCMQNDPGMRFPDAGQLRRFLDGL